jgi:hypothetical protein
MQPTFLTYVNFLWGWMILPFGIFIFWRWPLLGNSFCKKIEELGSALAHRKFLALMTLGVLVISVRAALLPLYPPPLPGINDEFSYLLAGDTFAHGRLTNPPHPMAPYFDTFHVLQQPTYASMYPPAQGLALALGQRLGNPWIGVILSMAAFIVALLWMLQGWFPAEWALLGATLVFLNLGIFSYWMNSFWGGAVAAFGGALVMGAVPRIIHHYRIRYLLIFVIGLGIVANSRPFEGLLLCAPLVAYFLAKILKGRFPRNVSYARLLVPLSAFLIVLLGFMAFYNWRVTGNALLFPHTLHDRQYLGGSNFVWASSTGSRHYINHQFEVMYNHWVPNQYFRTWSDFQRITIKKFGNFLGFFLEPVLFVPLIVFPWILLDHKTRLFVWQLIFYAAGATAVIWFHPHYAAPIAASFFGIIVQMLRHLRRWIFRGRPVGIGLTRMVVAQVVVTAIVAFAHIAANPFAPYSLGWGWYGNLHRASIERQLQAVPGNHLVIVRYSPTHHPVDDEWIYNAADIDGARIVWAREIPGVDLNPLLNYFKNRDTWLVQPDEKFSPAEPFTRMPGTTGTQSPPLLPPELEISGFSTKPAASSAAR